MVQVKGELVVVKDDGYSPFDLLVMINGSFLGGSGYYGYYISSFHMEYLL